MNHWIRMLADLPALGQLQIARANRVSLPRGAPAETRLQRLREAFCHEATVRVTYFALSPDAQAALQFLRDRRGGLTSDELAARFGAVRSWSEIRADPRPRTLSERLLLLGWLLPRPPAPRHPPRYLLPPELRRWLPRPLRLDDHGAAPAPPAVPAVHAARALLLAVAEHPLPLRRDGRARASARRMLLARLAPLPEADAGALLDFVYPLLIDLGLLAPHGSGAALAPAGARFLAQPAGQQLARLRSAWVRAPRLDAWLRPLLVDPRGINLPTLRRRFASWAAALPPGRLLDPTALYPALLAAFGPLADPQTHGFRRVDRAPWQPRRARAIWDGALRGPLTWLGLVGWADQARSLCFATPDAASDAMDEEADAHATPETQVPAWQYGAEIGELLVPSDGLDAEVLRLLPAARWQAAGAETTTYRLTARSLAAARRAGHAATALAALLERRAGPLPEDWRRLLAPAPEVHVIHAAVVISDAPAVLTRAAQARNLRRQLRQQLAPGIALADPARVPALTRALERQGVAAHVAGEPGVATVAELTPAERATLLAACAVYRAHAPAEISPEALADLEDRLRAGLPPALRPTPQPPVAPAADPAPLAEPPPETMALLDELRRAIRRRRPVELVYQAAGADAPTRRIVRPLLLENHGDHWYLRGYCALRQDERVFRVDRIAALTAMERGVLATSRRGRPARSEPSERRRPGSRGPRTGVIAPPPNPPEGSPLVRVWLVE